MNRTTRIKITELNPHVICVLCGGYYINATTITECLHSFCRTCITRYLETSKYCPVCDVMVHKTRPLDYIRSDKTLQDLVYKLVPGLYKSEMKRRREYYAIVDSPGVSQPPSEDRGDEFYDRIIYTEDEKISLSLELCADGIPFKTPINVHGHTGPENIRIKDVRYLQCPAAFSIGNLKKFIRMKFDLKMKFEIDIFHTAEPLPDYYSLMDIAYIYTWTRRAPLRLYYTVFVRKLPPKAPDPISRDQSNKVNDDEERVTTAGKKADDKHMNKKRKLLEGPDDISPDLDFEKCKPYKGERRKGLGTPKKRAKKVLVEIDDSVKEAMSESEEQLAKLTLDCSGDVRNGLCDSESVSSNVNTDNTEKDAEVENDKEGSTNYGSQKENVKSVVKASGKSKREDKCGSDILTNINIETNTPKEIATSDKNGAIQNEKDTASSTQSSAQVSPGSGSISLSLFQPLNEVTEEVSCEKVGTSEKVSEISAKNKDKTYEFQSEDTGVVKKARGRPKGSKNKTSQEKTVSVKTNETKADTETKNNVPKNPPGLKTPKGNETLKKTDTKPDTPSKKCVTKANTLDSDKASLTKNKSENGEKVKRRYVRKKKAEHSDDACREVKRPKKENNITEEGKVIENVPSAQGVMNENNTSDNIHKDNATENSQIKEQIDKEIPLKQTEFDNDNSVQNKPNSTNEHVSVNSSSLQEPVTPLYGETPKVNESNQGLPCSPNMDSFGEGGRLVIDTSVDDEDNDGANTKDSSDHTVVKGNNAHSNGAINENVNVKNGDLVSNRAMSEEIFRNGIFGIYDGNQSFNTSMNNSDIPNAHTEQYRNAINALSPTNALTILSSFSPPPMNAHLHMGHVTGSSFSSHEQNFDQPLDLTNNGTRDEYTKGKIFKTKMLKKSYPKQETVQCLKEKSTSSVNQILN